MLQCLLRHVADQVTEGQFTFSIVVVDNDLQQSARPIVENAILTATIPIEYRVEKRRGISLARNKALANIKGDFVAFVDDDEMPTTRWLLTLVELCDRHKAAGVVGTTKPKFIGNPPAWVLHGGFYDRLTQPTGSPVQWRHGRTGNVLFRQALFDHQHQAFREECLSGEDQDFFRRMIAIGHHFVWCGDVLAYEVIMPTRYARSFLLRKALLQGSVELHGPTFGANNVVRSVCAAAAYTLMLPIGLIIGHHHFMKYSLGLFHHLGCLLAVVGIRPIKAAYVSE